MSFLVELPLDFYNRSAFAEFSTAPGFHIGTARAMAWMSQLAYETRWPHKIDAVLAAWGMRPVALLANPVATKLPMTMTRGVVAAGHGATIVAFAGTDPLSLANWVTDFRIRLSGDDMHEGFKTAAASVWDDVRGAIEAGVRDGNAIFVTGHSLGGALAVVTTERALVELRRAPEATYTLGMPRAGGPAFSDRYTPPLGQTTYRLVHGHDIVPTVPPSRLGFHHVGRMLRCAPGRVFGPAQPLSSPDSDEPAFVEEAIESTKKGFLDLLSGQLPESFRPDTLGKLSRLLPPAISDHLPDRYCHAVDGVA